MSEAIVKFVGAIGFTFEPSYICPYREDALDKRKIKELAHAALNGCPVCHFHHATLLRRFADIDPDDEVFRDHGVPFGGVTVSMPQARIQWQDVNFFVQPANTMPFIQSCQFFTSAVKPPNISSIPIDGTSSDASIQKALEWLQQCTSSHPQCGTSEARKLPFRVLNISDDKVHLHEINNALGRYTCLSHCWGPPGDFPILQTLSATLTRHKESIPWSQLPQNFKDAISVTRRLGVDYIWIDSLCIIQDDAADWAKEAAQMASIYQNAYVTLGATRSSHSNGGLFNRPAARIEDAVETALQLVVDGTIVPIYAGGPMSHVDQYPKPMDEIETSPFPLLERAWVYQERMLSARFLHFAPYELSWECRAEFHCECGDTVTRPFKRTAQIRSLLSATGAENKAVDRGELWRWLVGEYSRLKITYGKDIFPALGGLAQRWNPDGSDRYCAGLWRGSLIRDLLWKTEDWRVEAERARPWRAPTWSWASVTHTPVTYMNHLSLKKTHAEVVDIVCTPTGPDLNGEIQVAYLVLTAKSLPGGVFYLDKSKDGLLESKVLFSHFRCMLSIKIKDARYTPLPGISPDVPAREKLDPSKVHVIMIADLEHRDKVSHTFLILKEREEEPGTYERLGMLMLDPSDTKCMEAYIEAGSTGDRDGNLQDKVKEISEEMTRDVLREFDEQLVQTIKIV